MAVVCGTDFSDAARGSAEVAAAIAERLKQPLVITHAVELPIGEDSATLEQQARRRLTEERRRLEALGARVDEHFAVGLPDEVLVADARFEKTQLLVLGAAGRRAASGTLGGSADRIAQSAHAPTLVVRQATPLLQWLKADRPLRVMVAVDFSRSAEAAAAWAARLDQLGPCVLTLVHLYWPPSEGKRVGFHGPLSLAAPNPDIERVLLRELQQRFAGLVEPHSVQFKVAPGLGRVADHLVFLAEQERADLVVVGTHGRTGLDRLWSGSVAHGVLRFATTSVACVPADRAGPGVALPSFRKVLAATDLSALGNRALAYAYSLVGPTGEVRLLHVLDGAPRPPNGTVEEAEAAPIVRTLLEHVPPLASALGIRTEVEVVQSRDVAQAICQAAERAGVDAVCLSSHGRSGLTRAVVGSVAQRVLELSHRPVLVVREKPES